MAQMEAKVALRLTDTYSTATPTLHDLGLWEDGGSSDPLTWRDLLLNATTLTVEYRKVAGGSWGSASIDLEKIGHYAHALATIPAAALDGTEWLVRFTIDGVVWGPISVRYP